LIFSEKKSKRLNIALALIIVMHGNFSLAENIVQEAPISQNAALQTSDQE
jgi:hypothetical protein